MEDRQDAIGVVTAAPCRFGKFEEVFEGLVADKRFDAIAHHQRGKALRRIDGEQDRAVVAALVVVLAQAGGVEQPEGLQFDRVLGQEIAQHEMGGDLREAAGEGSERAPHAVVVPPAQDAGGIGEAGGEARHRAQDGTGAGEGELASRALRAGLGERIAAVRAVHGGRIAVARQGRDVKIRGRRVAVARFWGFQAAGVD